MIIFVDILKFILLILVTFFSLQIITNKNKRVSYIGTLLICFSTPILEYINSGLIEAIFFGEIIFISIDRLLLKSKLSYLYSIMIPLGILGFLLLSNISFQIPIGVSIITLIIWRLLEFYILKKEQKNNLKKLKKKDDTEVTNKLNKGVIITLIIGILISLILGIVFYKYNPIKISINENGINYLTNYTYNFFTFDKKNLSAFNSIFPIALFIGVYYIFKDETKHSAFMIPTVLVSIIELFFLVSKANLSFIPNCIFALGFDLLQIFMVVYIFSRIEEKYFGLVKSSYISLIGLVFLLFMPVAKGINSAGVELSYIIFVLESYLLFNYQDKRFVRLASWVFTLICIPQTIGYLIVNFL